MSDVGMVLVCVGDDVPPGWIKNGISYKTELAVKRDVGSPKTANAKIEKHYETIVNGIGCCDHLLKWR